MIIKDLWTFIKQRKTYYLIPIILLLLTLGFLLVVAGSSALSPFIYTLF